MYNICGFNLCLNVIWSKNLREGTRCLFTLVLILWGYIACYVSAGKMMMSYSSNWFTLLLLYTSAPLVLCDDWFDLSSRQVKCEPVNVATEDYDVSLHQRMESIYCNFGFWHDLRLSSPYSPHDNPSACLIC